MKLRYIFLLIVVLTVVTGVGLVSLVSKYSLLDEFTKIEEDALIADIQRVQAQLENESDNLALICQDWAYWDDSYAFIQDQNQDFIASNLEAQTLIDLSINFIGYYDLSNNEVYAVWVDLEFEEEMPAPEWWRVWLEENELLITNPDAYLEKSGILHTPDGEMVIAVEPVLPSFDNGEQPVRGSLIFAYFFDENKKDKISLISGVSFDLIHLNEDPHPEFTAEELEQLNRSEMVFQFQEEIGNVVDRINAFYLVPNIFDDPDYIIHVSKAREIYSVGEKALDQFFNIILLIGLGLSFVFSFLVDRLFIRRIERASNIVKQIARTKDLSYKVPTEHDDEISVLGESINEMVLSLEQAQKDANRYEQRFQNILENMNLITIILDLEGKLTYCNQYLLDLTGYTREEIYGKDWYPIFVPEIESEPIRSKVYEHAVGQKNYVHGENNIVTKSGEHRLISWSNTPIMDNAGEPIGVASIGEDITIKAKAEAEIRRNEALLRSVLDAAPMIIGLIKDREIIWISDKVEAIVGYPVEAVIGKSPILFYKPEQHRIFGSLMDDIRKDISETSVSYQRTVWTRKDEIEIDIDLWVAAINPNQWDDGVIVAAIDVSEQVEAEARLSNSFDQIKTLLTRLSALRDIDQAITSPDDSDQTIQQILRLIRETVNLNVVMVSLYDKEKTGLRLVSMDGEEIVEGNALNHFGENELIREAVRTNQLVSQLSSSDQALDFVKQRLNTETDFSQYAVVPLNVKGETLGILEGLARDTICHGADCRDFLEAMAVQLAIALDNALLSQQREQAFAELQASYEATIQGWALALEMRDKETAGHSERVVNFTMRLAKQMGIDGKDLLHLRRGVLLHDIGKMGIPDRVLLKPGSLTEEEWVIMKQHPVHAFNLLKEIPYLAPALEIPYSHHERWDGSGYPQGLAGEEIPLGARIFAVIDIWDALTDDRPYRAAWSKEKTVQYLKENAGVLVDPRVVKEFLAMLVDLGEIPEDLS